MKKPFSLLFCGLAAAFITLAASAAHAGECSDAELTKAITEAMGREPQGAGKTGECDAARYPLVVAVDEKPSYEALVAKVKTVLTAPAATKVVADPSIPQKATRGGTRGGCNDPWVDQVIRELTGRAPFGSGNTGECNIMLYGRGSWNSYDDLRNKVRDGLFNRTGVAVANSCWGAMGSGCDALKAGIGDMKVGRTNLPDGHSYNMWISVGSIMHDNCCLNNPNGKWCSGNEFNHNGTCVKEWDKAFWNGMNGRAWTQTFSSRRTPDLRLVTNPRASRSLDGSRLVPFETVETRNFSAPRGQALDVGDESFCASGRATQYEEKTWWGTPTGKRWIVCQ